MSYGAGFRAPSGRRLDDFDPTMPSCILGSAGAVLAKEWQAGLFEASRLSAQAINSINEAVRVVPRAVPDSAAGRLALESAAKVDAELENIGDELIEQMAANGFERLLNRSLHRLEHLRKIHENLRLCPNADAKGTARTSLSVRRMDA